VSCSLLSLSGALPASCYSYIAIRQPLTTFFATHPRNPPITEHPTRMRVLSQHRESKDLNPPINPAFATDPKNPSITPLLATLPKSVVFNSFPCHTSDTPLGGHHEMRTRFPTRKSVLRSIATKDLSSNPSRHFSPACPELLGKHPSRAEGSLINPIRESATRSFVFILLRTLLHFFALTKNPTTFFSITSALFAKNHPGGGTPHSRKLDLRDFFLTFVTSLPRCC